MRRDDNRKGITASAKTQEQTRKSKAVPTSEALRTRWPDPIELDGGSGYHQPPAPYQDPRAVEAREVQLRMAMQQRREWAVQEEQRRVAQATRQCILNELADARAQLAAAERGQGLVANVIDGSGAGLSVGALGVAILGGVAKKKASSRQTAGWVAFAVVAAAQVDGARKHRERVESLRRRVRELERELALLVQPDLCRVATVS